eukprot:3650535-Rhodomonas_salina.4
MELGLTNYTVVEQAQGSSASSLSHPFIVNSHCPEPHSDNLTMLQQPLATSIRPLTRAGASRSS